VFADIAGRAAPTVKGNVLPNTAAPVDFKNILRLVFPDMPMSSFITLE
jgi:hypothetical protein